MSITIRIPPPLRKFTGGEQSIEVKAANLAEVFDALEGKYPGIKQNLCAEDGTPHRFMNVYVNDEDIRFLGPDYKFNQGDEVTLVPSIAGGLRIG